MPWNSDFSPSSGMGTNEVQAYLAHTKLSSFLLLSSLDLSDATICEP